VPPIPQQLLSVSTEYPAALRAPTILGLWELAFARHDSW
jgi:hypothetical protein